MKILHISTSDLAHGAGIAAYNLHLALNGLGHDSKMLLSIKQSNDNNAYQINRRIQKKIIDNFNIVLDRLFNQFTVPNILSSLPVNLSNHPLVQEADIINIHNLHWEARHFSLLILNALCKTKITTWTFHDMWPLTGHCIQSLDCERWKIGCGKCPYLNMPFTLKIDSTATLFQIKKRIYLNSNFTVITPSDWLKRIALASPLLSNKKIHCIPNGININKYKPIPKVIARESLNLCINTTKKIILFSTAHWSADFKGYPHFEKAILKLYETYPNLILLGFGNGDFSEHLKRRFQTLVFGYIGSERLKSVVYASADILVLPTLGDNLPSIVMESMACGTPVVSYNTGGIPDMIKHMETGYIAKHKDVNDLSQGIKTLAENDELRTKMSQKCVKTISENFTSEIQASRYLELYQEEIESRKKSDKLIFHS